MRTRLADRKKYLAVFPFSKRIGINILRSHSIYVGARRMLRRGCALRFVFSNRQHSDRERDRIARERQRRILYTAAGDVKLHGLLFLLWEEFRVPIVAVTAGVVFLVAYNRIVLYYSSLERAGERELDIKSEAGARQSGKLKSDRYLVKPWRQVDDPDFLNIPSHAGKGVYKSKLFEDDKPSTEPLYSERRRS